MAHGKGMRFAMSDLHVIPGGKESPPGQNNLIENFQPADDMQIGPPPSLLVGIITGVLGAGAAVISLLLFFEIWQPESYISQQWLLFVFAGAIIGFFLRLERSFDEAFSLSRSEEPSRR